MYKGERKKRIKRKKGKRNKRRERKEKGKGEIRKRRRLWGTNFD